MPAFDDFRAKAFPHRYRTKLHVKAMGGGIPTDPKVAESWIRSKLEDTDDAIRRLVTKTMAERGVSWDEAYNVVGNDRTLNGFKRDEHGLFIEGRIVKSMLKEAANIAANEGRIPANRVWGNPTDKNYLKGLKGWFPEHVFVLDDKIYIMDAQGNGMEDPSRIAQHFVHVGNRSAISYMEVVDDAYVEFTTVTDHAFTDETWAQIWLTGELNGLGSSRSQGYGRFTVIEWDRM